MEKNCGSGAQDFVGTEAGVTTTGHENERKRDEARDAGVAPSASSCGLDPSSCTDEERIRAECRKTCRRHFWAELLKSVAKVAGVILAAFGLSSFDAED